MRRDGAHSAPDGIVQSIYRVPLLRPGLGTTMRSLLVLLVALTMACGAAASVTIAHAPAYADDAGKGY